ncbi:MAG: ferrochelatase [Nakamurella sp.]
MTESPTVVRDRKSTTYDAVLVAGFGGPEGPDDVMPFLRNVTRGRGIPDERLHEVAHHYLALGGVSPINEHNRALKVALQEELARRGFDIPVLWGNRNWSPYLADTVREAQDSGYSSLLAVATSAYSSYSSCRQYRENFAAALIDTELVGEMRIDKLRPFYDLPGFLTPFADGVLAALGRAVDAGVSANDVTVIFTTHSIPETMAGASGTKADGRLYVEQHLAACAEVMHIVGEKHAEATDLTPSLTWRLAYQSRSGSPHTPWLEPDINDVIADIATGGSAAGVIVVPIGFISDHVEVIWDLDTEAAQTAAEHSLWFERVATSGTHPDFVAGLVDLIVERLDPTARAGERVLSATPLPARPDTCWPGCCRGRELRPTTAGADSAGDWISTPFDPQLLVASGIAGEAFGS